MKNILLNFNRAVLLTALVLTTTAVIYCNDDDDDPIDPNPVRTAQIQLSGAAEAPPITTTGSGTGQVTFTPATKAITYNINWTLGDPAATTVNMHFHGADNGSPTVSSPVTIGITGFTNASQGNVSGTTRALTDAEVDQLLSGKWYFNVHSSTYPSGELRGNIIFP